MSNHAKCNVCWQDVGDCAYITRCSHVFCERDAQKSFSKDGICPICDTNLQGRGGISLVEYSSMMDKTIQLCGLPPSAILDIASKALEFWDYQKQTELEYQKATCSNLLARSQQREKLLTDQVSEAKTKIPALQRQVQTLNEEVENYKKDLAELHAKYAEKSRQKRKLGELYDSLKHRTEEHRMESKSPSKVIGLQVQGDIFPFGVRKTEHPKHPLATNFTLEKSIPKDLDRFSLLRQRSPNAPAQNVIVPKSLVNSAFSPPRRPLYTTPKRPETPHFSRHFRGSKDQGTPRMASFCPNASIANTTASV